MKRIINQYRNNVIADIVLDEFENAINIWQTLLTLY